MSRILDLIESLKSGGERLPPRKELDLLADMRPEDRDLLREAWPHISLETRRRLVATLSKTAEADATAIFDDVFLVALGDPDEEVRLTALEGLWEYRDESFVPTLIRMMVSDPSVLVRAEAAMSLGKFAMAGELEEIDPQTTDMVRRALVAVWNSPDQDVEVRRRALESVSCLTSDEIGSMIEAAYRDKDERMNVSAVYAMGQTLDEVWAPYVLKELRSPRPEMRYEAAQAAGELQLTDAVPTLLDMVNDPDTDVRLVAIEALGVIGGERAIQALMELARNENEAIREAALDALDVAEFEEDPLGPGIMSWLFVQDAETLKSMGWDEDIDEDVDEDEFEGDDDEWERDADRDRWN